MKTRAISEIEQSHAYEKALGGTLSAPRRMSTTACVGCTSVSTVREGIAMHSVYFKPWIGAKYHNGVPHKLLILGESHYASTPQPATFTIDLCQHYSDGQWTHPYWTRIMRVVEGRRYWEIDRRDFWSRVAFYNFIQELAGDGPKSGHTTLAQ